MIFNVMHILLYILQISNYEKELEEMKNMTRQEFVASLRRYSILFQASATSFYGFFF